MSRRKLGLCVTKNYSRKRRCCNTEKKLLVRVPLTALPESEELLIRLPLAAYTSTALHDNIQLQQRLSESGNMPDEWTLSLLPPKSAPVLSLYTLRVLPPLLSCTGVCHMITVSPDGSWTLCVGGRQVGAQTSELLSGCPDKLLSAQDVVGVMSVIKGGRYCIGNPDDKFSALVERNGGNFRDKSGK